MDETQFKLGQLLAGQENLNRDVGRFRDEAVRTAEIASSSRQELHKTINDLKDKLVDEVNTLKNNQGLINERLEYATNRINLMTPNIDDIPRIQKVLVKIDGAHEEMKKTVTALHNAKLSMEGAASGVMAASKMWWIVLVGIGSMIGTIVTAAWHWLQSGLTPGR